ncbi:Immunoglobulin superfamily member 5 [Channa argus]|uniref:immunoglobulin superfamily member 5 isoform X2 n=1 Tax=Channa argus TaxID=215402 RepID=UPI0014179386|nr:Immunoglobulin superfamily member 5 [Channa argus]
MAVSWKSWPNLLWIYLILGTTGVSGQFELQPLNSTVLQGSDVRFRATVQGQWNVMTWNVGGFLVLTVVVPGNITSSSQFSATFCSSDDSCVDFTIHNVSRRDSGPVICSVQGQYGSRTAQLNVEESGTVSIMGGNVTVEKEQHVEFKCITTAWFPKPAVSWAQNGQDVNTSLYNTTSMFDGDSYTSTSVLQFQAVTNTTVECQATVQTLINPKTTSVFLSVVPKPPDWTVLIAVVVSFGGCALLVLLILGIIFCYRRRKEKQSSYQDEMSRRVRRQSQGQGQVNTGYVPEGRTSAAASELNDSGFCQANGSNIAERPDVKSNQTEKDYSSAYHNVDQSCFRKHRHVTIV